MPLIDLAFRLMGTTIPVDHGYVLYSALARLVPALHDAAEVGVHPIRGRYQGDGALALAAFSRLTLRLPDHGIPTFLPLAGKALDLEGHRLRVGVPEVRALRAAATLYARLVTIKGFLEPAPFLEAARRQLHDMGVVADLQVGVRRTVRVKDKPAVGFDVIAAGLSPEASVRLQEEGIGGRRRLGCGIFLPWRGTPAR